MGYKAKTKDKVEGTGRTARSCDPEVTKQWEGHLRRLRHEAEQERERRLRRGLSEKKGKK